MRFCDFSQLNRERCTSPNGFAHALSSWSLSDWLTATVGELGEAANIAKKLNRVRDGIPGNDQSEEELRAAFKEEIADVFIYLDLLAQSEGFLLEDAVQEKFAKTSRKIGYEPKRKGMNAAGEYVEPDAYQHIDSDGRIAADRDS